MQVSTERQRRLSNGSGRIEVVCGSMFSGKTEELIRRLKRALIAKQKIQSFKPLVDNRYHNESIVSHNENKLESVAVKTPKEILDKIQAGTEVVGIDEVQFFDESVVGLVEYLANRGYRVIVAGLDQDSYGNPFGPVPKLLAIAEFITKTLAICVRCGAPANKSFRMCGSSEQVEVGAFDKYEARCRRCYLLGKNIE